MLVIRLVFITLFLLSIFVYSKAYEDYYVNLHLGSYHYKHNSLYNNENLGLGIIKKDDKKSYYLGFYKNSFEKTSFYTGISRDFNSYFSLAFLVSSGYNVKEYNSKPVLNGKYCRDLCFMYFFIFNLDNFLISINHKLIHISYIIPIY